MGKTFMPVKDLIAVALGKIFAGEPITVWGDGSNVRDYIYIDDLCKAVVQLIEKDVHNTTINIGSGEGVSINDIIRVLKEVVDEKVKVDYLPARSVDVSHMILDTSRLKRYINMNFTSLHEGMTIFYRELKEKIKK